MSSHISIGAVFAGAWALLRQRFIAIFLLSFLQGLWFLALLFWGEIVFRLTVWLNLDVFALFGSTAFLLGAAALAALCFLLSSMGVVLITRTDKATGSSPAKMLIRRFLPTLLATLLCLGIVYLSVYGFTMLIGRPNGLTVLLFEAAQLIVLIAVSSIIFVTFPAAVLERGGPFRAVARSYALTKGQRWRIGAISLILVIGATFPVIMTYNFFLRLALQYGYAFDIVLRAAAYLICWASMLCLTMLVISTYHHLVRIKDGISATEAGGVFE